MLKTGLNIAHFKEHVKIIEAETIEYFQRWGDSGEKSKILHKYMYIRKVTSDRLILESKTAEPNASRKMVS